MSTRSGSLCAPLTLQEVFARYKQGAVPETELDRAKDEAIRGIVGKQAAIGLPVVTDGELRRRNFQESFGSSVSGFEVAAEDRAMEGVNTTPLARAEQNFSAPGPAIVTRRKVVERLRLARNVPLDEYKFTSALTDRPVKATVLSPDRISQRFDWQNSTTVYPDMDAFMADVVAITRQIIRQLVDAGCRYIQIDAPGYTAYVDQVSLDRMRSRGEDPKRNLESSIAADNAVIEGFDGITFGIHLCKGNARTIDPATGKVTPQWHREGTYDGIAEQVVLAAQAPPHPAGIRRRALRRLRAAQAYGEGNGCGAGAGHDQAAGPGALRSPEAAHRRSEPPSSGRATGAQPAMRLRRS